MSVVPFTEEDLHELYLWVDEVPLSRPKRNIARDFADGCCVAEILKYYFPRLVDLHNYAPAMSRSKKLDNWRTLNAKVLRRLYFEVPNEEVEDIITAVPGAIERFLRALRIKIISIKNRRDELVETYQINNHDVEDEADPVIANYANNQQQQQSKNNKRNDSAGVTRGSVRSATRSASGNRNSNNNNNMQQPQRGGGEGDEEAVAMQEANRKDMQEIKELLLEKDRTILELRETVGILSEKIMKLEELVKVKDDKLYQYRKMYETVGTFHFH